MTVEPTDRCSASSKQSEAFMRDTLLPALPVEGGFAGAPEERTADIAHHDAI